MLSRAVVLARWVLNDLRQRRVIISSLDVIECLCAEATTRANQRLYRLPSQPAGSQRPKAGSIAAVSQ